MSFEEALFLAKAIQTHGSGQRVRRLTLFEALKRSPDSSTSRKLITASRQYGLTTGSYAAEWLQLTSLGTTATDPNAAPATKAAARAECAISKIAPFNAIYEKYKGSRLPASQVLRDAAREVGVADSKAAECVETFLANARDLHLIRNIGGTEHLVAIEQLVDQVAEQAGKDTDLAQPVAENDYTEVVAASELKGSDKGRRRETSKAQVTATAMTADTCFVISPIGDPGSEQRKHADLVLTSLIEPALKELNLRAVRADRISRPGLITGQIIEQLTKARLVIADLSFSNPNVYYELALRHATRKPVVQIIRTADKLPFDVGQFRTVTIDTTDIYTLVPQIELHLQEITRQCRAALEDMRDQGTAESPLSRFYPEFWDEIAGKHPDRTPPST
ncbi:MAG: hypothetical protein M0027_15240 [Candidatus Dormibacteraeota bacterium]|jgi:hypothetical protein|nr:hypothetical protein [Candidatus Dormibacteraeota bacterium]